MEIKDLCKELRHRLQMEKVEADLDARLTQKKDESVMASNSIDEQFKMEMLRMKIEKQNEEKINMLLCQNISELKEIKRKMQKAKIDKEVLAQINDKRDILTKEKLDSIHFEDVMKSKLANSKNLEIQKAEEASVIKLKYKEELLNQIQQLNEKKNKKFLSDKAMLEFTMQTTKDQNKREEEIKINKLKKLKCDMEEAKILRELYDKKNKQSSDDEDRRIQHYKDLQLKREKEKHEKNKEIERQKQQQQEQLSSNFSTYINNTDKKHEKEEISHYLAEEKLKEKNFEREKDELAKSHRWREELQRAAKTQREEKIKTIEEENIQDIEIRKQLEKEVAKDGSLAHLQLEKKRQEKLEYGNHLKEQIEDKHRRQIECWQQEIAFEKLRQAEKNRIDTFVNDEHIKMKMGISNCLN